METIVKITHVSQILEQVAIVMTKMNKEQVSDRFAATQQKLLNTAISVERDTLRHNQHIGDKTPIDFYKHE